MPVFRRNTGPNRGPSPIFKKRFVRFSQGMANTTPIIIGNIQIEETGTIYSAKVEAFTKSLSTDPDDVQETSIGLYCRDPTVSGTNVPDYADAQDIEIMNGFHVATLWAAGHAVDTNSLDIASYVREKFRFRRKCDRNSNVTLFGDTIVRNGAAASTVCFGTITLVIRTR